MKLTHDVTCNKCGRVHFQVSRDHAIDCVTRFNAYYMTLTPEQQQDFYGGKMSNIKSYEHCMFCNGPYINFRDSVEGDCPPGCTLSPIIARDQ